MLEHVALSFKIVQALKLEEIGGNGSDAENVCYLRNLEDADKLIRVMRSCPGGDAVVIGGGYIGMECAAALVANNIKVTIVFPGKHCSTQLKLLFGEHPEVSILGV